MATDTYVETDCTITHEGQTFESGGAAITPAYAIAYVGSIKGDLATLTTWRGIEIGAGRIIARWYVPGYISSTMYQIEATLNGVRYTGRSTGTGMIWKGKRTAKQPIVACPLCHTQFDTRSALESHNAYWHTEWPINP